MRFNSLLDLGQGGQPAILVIVSPFAGWGDAGSWASLAGHQQQD